MYKGFFSLLFFIFVFTGVSHSQTVSGLYDDLPLADHILGDADAPITIVEYASMTCPHCRSFHEIVLPSIKEKYIDTGKVKLILRPFPFQGDRRGEAAFMLANCVPNNNYYSMIDALFASQDVWGDGSKNPVPELKRLAKLAGMSTSAFEDCLSQQDLLDQLIASRERAADDFGVQATPTIFLNDRKFSGDLTVEGLGKALDDLE